MMNDPSEHIFIIDIIDIHFIYSSVIHFIYTTIDDNHNFNRHFAARLGDLRGLLRGADGGTGGSLDGAGTWLIIWVDLPHLSTKMDR